jgi:hypothetical protein
MSKVQEPPTYEQWQEREIERLMKKPNGVDLRLFLKRIFGVEPKVDE